MNSKRTYFLMLGAVALLVIGILGGAYETKQYLTVKSVKLVELKAKLAGYEQQQAGLVSAKKEIAKYTPLYNIAKVIVPENKNQAETVRQIDKLASANSINLGTISFPSSTLGNTVTGGPNVPLPTTTLGGNTKVMPKTNTTNLSQLTAVVGSPGVYVLQISVSSDTSQPASYKQLIGFLSALENNRLTAEVTSINIVPDTLAPDRFSFTLSLNSYIKP